MSIEAAIDKMDERVELTLREMAGGDGVSLQQLLLGNDPLILIEFDYDTDANELVTRIDATGPSDRLELADILEAGARALREMEVSS